jgi:hypothetical protein
MARRPPIGITVDPGPDALAGTTPNPNALAVGGVNTGNQSSGFIAGPEPFGKSPVGLFGRSNNTGVFGFSDKAGGGFGVAGNTNAGTGTGVHGHTSTGVGVLGTSDGTGPAGRFQGNVEVTGDLSVQGQFKGNIQCAGDIILLNEDLSEDFEVASERCLDSGTVMVIDSQGNLSECQQPYDKRVAGVIAGGGEFRSAIVLGRQASAQMRLPIALVGKVSCKVDASYSPIEIGDMLTTSPTPGHAMRVTDSGRAFGAVIGKALRPLAEGRGHIPILVALQ